MTTDPNSDDFVVDSAIADDVAQASEPVPTEGSADADSESSIAGDDPAIDPEAALLPAGVLLLYGYPEKTMLDMWNARKAAIGDEAATAAVQRAGTYENFIAQIADNARKNMSAYLTNAVIDRLTDEERQMLAPRYIDEAHKIKVGSAPQRRLAPPTETQELKGTEGFLRMMMDSANAIRRVTLLNSGFYIDIRAPVKEQLHDLVVRMDLTIQEYGRWAGVYYFIYADIELKRLVAELLLSCVVSTNLRDGKNPAVMMEHFKLPDLLPAIMQLAHLMYPDGYPNFQHICTNTECRHTSAHTVDLSKFVLHNFSRIPATALQKMSLPYPGSGVGSNQVTGDRLKAYGAELGLSKKLTFGKYTFTMKVPSLADYFNYGDQFNIRLMEVHQASSSEEIVDGVEARMASIFTPWIERVEVHDDTVSDGNDRRVTMTSQDPTTITPLLNYLQSDSDGVNANRAFVKALTEYAADTQLSLVCTPAMPCPTCGTVPTTENGFFTVDPISCFFMMCLSKWVST